jgi:hypothetical protein
MLSWRSDGPLGKGDGFDRFHRLEHTTRWRTAEILGVKDHSKPVMYNDTVHYTDRGTPAHGPIPGGADAWQTRDLDVGDR